jgi:hypothetical protein
MNGLTLQYDRLKPEAVETLPENGMAKRFQPCHTFNLTVNSFRLAFITSDTADVAFQYGRHEPESYKFQRMKTLLQTGIGLAQFMHS